MKRLLGVLALLLVGGLVVWQTSTQIADAQRTFTAQVDILKDSPDGYATSVCSSFVNNATVTAHWRKIGAPTGYDFHGIHIIPAMAVAGTDQDVVLRFFDSDNDSTTIIDASITLMMAGSNASPYYFPVKCDSVMVSDIDATDDYVFIGYTKAE